MFRTAAGAEVTQTPCKGLRPLSMAVVERARESRRGGGDRCPNRPVTSYRTRPRSLDALRFLLQSQGGTG